MAEVVGVPSTIVVAVDPSPVAAAALSWASMMARNCGAEVVVVHARGLLEEAAQADQADDLLPAWLVELVEGIDPEVALRIATEEGPPPEVVLRVAAREAAGLIVVGRRGAGSPFELTLGSTSREITSRSPVPVAVVPAH